MDAGSGGDSGRFLHCKSGAGSAGTEQPGGRDYKRYGVQGFNEPLPFDWRGRSGGAGHDKDSDRG